MYNSTVLDLNEFVLATQLTAMFRMVAVFRIRIRILKSQVQIWIRTKISRIRKLANGLGSVPGIKLLTLFFLLHAEVSDICCHCRPPCFAHSVCIL
jgi:hypothetical protein